MEMSLKPIPLKILIVEDDALQRINLQKALKDFGHDVQCVESRIQALDIISKIKFDISFVDLDLDEKRAGFQLVPVFKSNGIYTIILSGHREEAYVEEGYQVECDDYLTKPFKLSAIQDVLSKYGGSEEKARLRKLISKKFLTQDEDHLKQYDILVENMNTKIPIHILGPSGVGKSELAKIIHEGSFNHFDNYVEFSPDGLQDSILQSELFGHVDGSFTGAKGRRTGKLGKAHNGTLFIDEIATIGLRMQQALLGPLSNGNYSPVGSDQILHSDFKLITATCEDLYQKIAGKTFREDFYNRISGFKIHFKGLKQRPKDLELLLDHVQKNFGGGRGMVIRADARKVLMNYDWPGNEREFFHFWDSKRNIKKPIFSASDISAQILKNEYPGKFSYKIATADQISYVEKVGLNQFISELEKEIAEHFVKRAGKERPVRFLMRNLDVSQNKVKGLLNDMGVIR